MGAVSVGSITQISELGPGDHACLVYDDEERRDELLVSYARAGLGRGERVLCLSDAVPRDLERRLAVVGRPGQLSFGRATETFLPDGPGSFTADSVLGRWQSAVERSIEDGFGALCAVGEPPHALTSNGSGQSLVDYERRASCLFDSQNLVGLCLYDTRKTDPRTLLSIVDAHPITLYAVAPDPRLQIMDDGSRRLVLSGWVDVSTIGGLADRLERLAREPGDAEVDLERVEFVDIAALRLFVQAGSRLNRGGHALTLARPPEWIPSVLRVLGYDACDGLVIA
jgi:ABC-type transporter Mla MlaB component